MRDLYFPAPFLGCLLRIAADYHQLQDDDRAFYCIDHSRILSNFSEMNSRVLAVTSNLKEEPADQGMIWSYANVNPADHQFASCGIINMYPYIDDLDKHALGVTKFLAELAYINLIQSELLEIDSVKASKPLDPSEITDDFIGRCIGFSKATGRWRDQDYPKLLLPVFQHSGRRELRALPIIKPEPENLPETLTDIARLYPTVQATLNISVLAGIYALISDVLFYDLARMP